MNFSSASILKMQRLARTVKKELNLPVHIRSKEGIGELLRWAQSETKSAAVFEKYSDFISTLTEQDKKELISYNVAITANSASNVTEVAPHESVVEEERRKVEQPVEHEIRVGKKARYYRGVLIEDMDEDEVKSEVSLEREGQHTYHGRTYRGVAIEEESAHQKEEGATPKKKKRVRMYRGHPIED